MRVEVAADADTVYGMISDHRFLSQIDGTFGSVRTRSVRPQTSVSEETISLGGRAYRCMVRHAFDPPCGHQYRVIGGDAKGSSVTETLQAMSGGTRITARIEWKTGLLRGGGRILEDYSRMLERVKSRAEG